MTEKNINGTVHETGPDPEQIEEVETTKPETIYFVVVYRADEHGQREEKIDGAYRNLKTAQERATFFRDMSANVEILDAPIKG
jgi:hypothetical protein